MALTPFQVLADLTHLFSTLVLIWAIHRNRSAEGVSLLTQALYLLVFITRYLDIFDTWSNRYLTPFKIYFILSSIYTILLMTKVYPRTRERERAWKMALACIGGSLVLAPIVIPIFYSQKFGKHWFKMLMYVFSRILESVCVLPQLLLLRQTTVPTVIDSYYLLALGLYRVFYILNWIMKGVAAEFYVDYGRLDLIAIIFGVIQTLFYFDFAWVYYTRQRVKLRNGGVVDSEDFRNSWFLNKVLTFRQRQSQDDEEQRLQDGHSDDGHGQRPENNRWGARGISISADDTLEHHHASNDTEEFLDDEGFEDHTPDQRRQEHSPLNRRDY